LIVGAIWLVRHAPAAVRGICYGQSEVAVTLSADAAAQRVIEATEGVSWDSFTEVWSSPWSRTFPVAKLVAAWWAVNVRVDARLSELAFGAWEGRSYQEIEAEDPSGFDAWMQDYETRAPPGGETGALLRRRVSAWLLERQRDDRTILAVTHAGVIRMARSITVGLPYAEVAVEEIPHLVPERVSFAENWAARIPPE
jgi:alpha-ribazole phosphatase